MAITSVAENVVGSLELMRMFTTGGSVCVEPLGTRSLVVACIFCGNGNNCVGELLKCIKLLSM